MLSAVRYVATCSLKIAMYSYSQLYVAYSYIELHTVKNDLVNFTPEISSETLATVLTGNPAVNFTVFINSENHRRSLRELNQPAGDDPLQLKYPQQQ